MEERGAARTAERLGESSGETWKQAAPTRLLLRLPFTSDPSAPSRARTAVTAALHGSSQLDEITLMVSELVTNAVLHAGARAELRVFDLGGGDVRVEVQDDDCRVPAPTPTTGPDGGFGLRIVGAHARAWGASVHHDGKVVWFEVGGTSFVRTNPSD